MIYINHDSVEELEFINLLSKTRDRMLKNALRKEVSEQPSALEFEMMVFEIMAKSAKGTSFEGRVMKAGKHAFPDIIAKKFYGVEVKTTTGDKWISIGNSVLETTRVEGVERIYFFFAKFGGDFDIKYRPYQECLYEVSVTHSPRYKIDMTLSSGESIFDKMNVHYEIVRNDDDPISYFKDYYRSKLKPDEELWWIDKEAEEEGVSPIITSYNSLDSKTKDKFIAECFVFFPEVFSSKPTKYERPAAFLITNYNAVTANIRDKFTANGQRDIVLNGSPITVPHIVYELFSRAHLVREVLENVEEKKLLNYWRTSQLQKSRLELWLEKITQQSNWQEGGFILKDVFEEGLSERKNKQLSR